MKTFVINLQRSPERRKYISSHLKSFGIDFEIVEGVDGRMLKQEELEKFCDIAAIKRTPQWLNKGAIGCALSHLKVYQKIVDNNLERAFILEDDLVLPGNIKMVLSDIDKNQKENEIILLFYASFTSCPLSKEGMIKINNGHLVYPVVAIQPISAAAYCISQKAARGILVSAFPIRVAADSWNYYYQKKAFSSLRCYYPMQLNVKHYKSAIDYIDPGSFKGKISQWIDKYKIPGIYHLLKIQREITIKEKTSQFFLSGEISPLMIKSDYES
jgi:glycosyl transferase, family 25